MAEGLLPEIVDGNITMKKKLANGLFEYINLLSGPMNALKITCMVTNLKISNDDIKAYLGSFSQLRMRVLQQERLDRKQTEEEEK